VLRRGDVYECWLVGLRNKVRVLIEVLGGLLVRFM
jgi:hypothetical protein